MTCLEAQSNIIAYIDDNLDKDKKIEFLKHVQSCEDCKEELDIYYTMIEGMRQMDSNLPISRDFKAELNTRMNRELSQNKKQKGLFRSSMLIVLFGVLGFAIVAYVNFLNLLYADEQEKLKEAQGEYYYSDTFDEILFEPESKILNINAEPPEEPEKTFYQRVREYRAFR